MKQKANLVPEEFYSIYYAMYNYYISRMQLQLWEKGGDFPCPFLKIKKMPWFLK